MLVSALTIFTPDRAQLEQAAVLAQSVLDDGSMAIAEVARRDFDRLVVLGAGCLEGTAREAALKCLELTAGRVVAIHDTPLGFRHGPKIVIGESTVVDGVTIYPFRSRGQLAVDDRSRSMCPVSRGKM